MPIVSYDSVNGEILGMRQDSNARIGFLPNGRGDVTAAVDQTQSVQATAKLAPYGLPFYATSPVTALGVTSPTQDPRYSGYVRMYGYRRTQPQHAEYATQYRHLATTLSQWTTVDPLWPSQPAYTYGGGNPVTLIDPTGLEPQAGQNIRSHCYARSLKYCRDSQKDPNNPAKRGFCRVSYLLCRFVIHDTRESLQVRGCIDCVNKCMFDHYEKRFDPKSPCWSIATDPLKRGGLYKGDECMWYIRCEQIGLTGCVKKSCQAACPGGVLPHLQMTLNLWPFPFTGSESARVSRGQHLICQPGKFGKIDFIIDIGQLIDNCRSHIK